jgi:RuvB-like protein 2
MLDIECFSFLNRALEGEMAPLVVMASNRGISRIRGTRYKSPHGIPVDLLDRLLIISTKPYDHADMKEISKIRCVPIFHIVYWLTSRADEEDVKLAPDALELIATIGQETSLRYCLNLIAPCHLLAQRRKSPTVEVEDIRLAYTYFSDVARSTTYAKETAGMMFGEEEVAENGNGGIDFTS